ncbi:hypothetical protein MYA_0705 [Burkholderia sp. KJ006]|jgi:hypothetical protein|nr:hypothetical protein MYA_0705 [Burkholderia sp. KJ006]
MGVAMPATSASASQHARSTRLHERGASWPTWRVRCADRFSEIDCADDLPKYDDGGPE